MKLKTKTKTHQKYSEIEPFFLDTNILLGRAFKFEKNYLKCKNILRARNEKYTSKSVRNEIVRVIDRRKKYSRKLAVLKYKSREFRKKSGNIDKFVERIAINENDETFLKNIWRFLLNKHRGKDWLGMYQIHLNLVEEILERCLTIEVLNPLIAVSTDSKALNLLTKITDNEMDSQIILDMIYGFKSKKRVINFTTNDRKDIINQEKDIQDWFCDYFHIDCFFRIIGVSEAIKKSVF